jgi:hypothetical protein
VTGRRRGPRSSTWPAGTATTTTGISGIRTGTGPAAT